MVIYTSFVVQSNRRAEEAAVTAAVQTQTAAVAGPRRTATVSETLQTENWELYASTPLPASLQPIWADSAAQVEEVARWGRGTLSSVAWSPDGGLLAVGTSFGVYLYDPETLEASTFLDIGDSVGPMVFSPDSQFLALALGGGRAQLWSIVDGTLLQIVEGVGDNAAVAFSPAGQFLLAWMPPGDAAPILWRDGTSMQLSLPPGETTLVPLETSPDGHPVGVAAGPVAVALSPDGRFVAAGLADGTVYLWSAVDGGLLTTLAAGANLDSLAFSPTGRLLATATEDAGVEIWQTEEATRLYALERGIAGPLSLAFSSDGRRLAVAGSSAVRFYGMDTGALVRWIEFSEDTTGAASLFPTARAQVAFSADSQVLVVLGRFAEHLILFRVEDSKLLQTVSGFALPWSGLALSPDSRTLAVRSFLDESIWLWDVQQGGVERVLRPQDSSAWNHWRAGAFSPDSLLLAVGDGAQVSIWAVERGTVRDRLPPDTETMNPVAVANSLVQCTVFAPDGRWLAAASSQGRMLLWQVATGELRWTSVVTSTPSVDSPLCSLAFSPGGQYLASSWLGSAVYLWRAADGMLVHRWDVAQEWASGGATFSPDGQLLAAWTAPGEVSLWQVAGGEVVRTLAAPTEAGMELAFSPDGSVLAGGSAGGAIYLWRTGDGMLLHVLEGHTSWVGGLAFSADEHLLFSASGDGTVRVWGVR
jgi:WD40 repeat protein